MKKHKKVTLDERFWSKVEKTDGCWIWLGGSNPAGYGRFKIRGKLKSPHRLVYEWYYGQIPDGYDVCHKCDNPRCVNPLHLFVGTRSGNMQDAVRKGRVILPPASCGEKNHSKLTAAQVKQIRCEYAEGQTTYKKLAERYGVDFTLIGQIVRREVWTHI